MLHDALQFLLRVVFDLAATAFWLRFYMQWTRVPFHNPFSQFIVKVTDFAVKPARRLIPGMFGLDWASLLLFIAAEFLWVLSSHLVSGYPFLAAAGSVWPGFLLFTMAVCLKLAIYILMALIFIQAVISWVNPFSPMAPIFYAMARPVLAPFQRIVPHVGNFDLSPLTAFIVLQLVLIAPVAGLERSAYAMIW